MGVGEGGGAEHLPLEKPVVFSAMLVGGSGCTFSGKNYSFR